MNEMNEEIDRDALAKQLLRDEGYKSRPYRDSVGILTIGIGRNLEAVGIRKDEALYMLQNDIDECEVHLDRTLPWWRYLPAARQSVLVNMCFNMGIQRLLKFKKFLAALNQQNYPEAAKEMLDSKWAEQVGARAVRLSKQIETGELQ